jgi:hypothetical protein
VDAEQLVLAALKELRDQVVALNESVNRALTTLAGHDARLQEGSRTISDHGQRLRDLEGRPCPAHAEQIRTLFSRIDAIEVRATACELRINDLDKSGAKLSVGLVVGAVLASAVLTGAIPFVIRALMGVTP